MGTYYELNGSIPVRDCPESRALVDVFNETGFDITASIREAVDRPGEITVDIFGGDSMSYSTAEEIDDAAQAFGPYATSGTMLFYECDGDRGQLYVGPDEGEPQARSEWAMSEIDNMLLSLTHSDMERLIGKLQERLATVKA